MARQISPVAGLGTDKEAFRKTLSRFCLALSVARSHRLVLFHRMRTSVFNECGWHLHGFHTPLPLCRLRLRTHLP